MVIPKKGTSVPVYSKKTKKSVGKGGYVESSVVDRDADLSEQVLINIHGPSSSGKTIAGLTISKHWPKTFPARNKKRTMLRDVLHVSWDAAALVGAKSAGIDVAYPINALSLLAKERKTGKPKAVDVLEASEMIQEEVGNIVAHDTQVQFVIDDTISRMDRYLFSFWAHPDNIPIGHNGEEDTRGLYRHMLTSHNLYFNERIQLPSDVTSIFLFHCRIIGDEQAKGMSKEQKDRAKLIRLNADVTIIPSVTGQGLDLYTNDASIELACIPVQANKGKEPDRRLYVMPHRGYRTKNRFAHLFPEYVSANLRPVYDRIQKACRT